MTRPDWLLSHLDINYRELSFLDTSWRYSNYICKCLKRDNIPNERINFLLEYMQAKYHSEKERPWYDSPTIPNYEENYEENYD